MKEAGYLTDKNGVPIDAITGLPVTQSGAWTFTPSQASYQVAVLEEIRDTLKRTNLYLAAIFGETSFASAGESDLDSA